MSANWNDEQRRVFARMFRHLTAHPHLFMHPDAPPLAREHWETTAYNAAWMAAHCSDPNFKPMCHADADGSILAIEVDPSLPLN